MPKKNKSTKGAEKVYKKLESQILAAATEGASDNDALNQWLEQLSGVHEVSARVTAHTMHSGTSVRVTAQSIQRMATRSCVAFCGFLFFFSRFAVR